MRRFARGSGWAGAAAVAGVVVAGLSVSAPVTGAPAANVVLTPHRAVYDLTLSSTKSGSKVTGVTGRMVYELTGSRCAGYSQSMRIVTETSTQEGETTLSDQRSTSWEDADGKKMNFEWMVYRDQDLSESTAGVATRSDDGQTIKIDLSAPERKQAEVAGSALFPVQHSIRMIEAARAGQSMFKADFYDGSEGGEKVYDTTTFIGNKVATGANKKLPKITNAEKLDTVTAWPVSISYFEPGIGNKDQVPAYELGFLMFENGVSRKLLMDYGDQIIKGDLKEITFLDQPPCVGH